MIRVDADAGASIPDGALVVGLPVVPAPDGPAWCGPVPAALAAPGGLDPAWCARYGFTGAAGQTLVLHRPPVPGDAAPELVLVGVGEQGDDDDRRLESVRRAAAAFVRAAGRGGTVALVLPALDGPAPRRVARAAAEGGALASYRFGRYQGDRPARRPEVLVVWSPGEGGAAAGVAEGARVADSVAYARDLVNEPAGVLTPTALAERVVDRFAGVDTVVVEVWDEERIAAERLGGLLGVARGSDQPPRLLRLAYEPADPVEVDGIVPHLALVGKGITFDSGGLSLKTPGGMETMKTDMGGAAAVVAAVDAAAALGARIRLTAWAPLTENLPGPSALKPGDVLTPRSGTTIEVLNTDAEGRLVLADALSLAAEEDPGAVIDLATLTGAVSVALGKEIAAVLGNDDGVVDAVRAAAGRSGEAVWPLPLAEAYRSHIDSDVADLKNQGKPGQAGTITAALLLREYVGGRPWAHLDIAGTSRSDEDTRYVTKGGTGYGVRLLLELVLDDDLPRLLVGRPG